MEDGYPSELRYTTSDEWVRRTGDIMETGITTFASEQLGDVVYIKLPDVGAHFNEGEAYGEIESVKAVSDLNVPLAGTITEANEELDANPALVNDDPYGAGWIIRFRADSPEQFDSLLDAARYQEHTAEQH